jgi:hypothetical protein
VTLDRGQREARGCPWGSYSHPRPVCVRACERMSVWLCACVCVCVCVCVGVCLFAYMCVCMCVCVFVGVCISVRMCKYVCM